MRCSHTGRLLAVAAGVIVMGAGAADVRAATVPVGGYFENFDGYSPGGDVPVTNFAESSTAAYTVQPDTAGFDYQAAQSVSSATGTNASSGIDFSNVTSAGLAGQTFAMKTTFRVDSLSTTTGATINAGFGGFGTVANFSDTSGSNGQYRLLYTLVAGSNVGKLSLSENQASGQGGLTGTLLSDGTVPVSTSSEYTLTMYARFSGATLLIDGYVTDGTNTAFLRAQDTSPRAGTFFGYRTALNQTAASGTTAYNVDYDNFEAYVPEPASVALLAVGAAGLLARCRRATASR